MPTALVTGSAGLIGSECVSLFSERGFDVVGIDNDMRSAFFGPEASTRWNRQRLIETLGSRYRHCNVDIRDRAATEQIFRERGADIALIIHTASQPSHDWAARDPHTDFSVNANGTLVLLEHMRRYCPDAVFIFCSTNKVYGDNPNLLPLVEEETRWEIAARPSVLCWHRRDHECRLLQALTFRCFEAGGGCTRAGVRALLRAQDREFPRRLFDGSRPRRRRAARISVLPGEVHPLRCALHESTATRRSRFETTFTATTW